MTGVFLGGREKYVDRFPAEMRHLHAESNLSKYFSRPPKNYTDRHLVETLSVMKYDCKMGMLFFIYENEELQERGNSKQSAFLIVDTFSAMNYARCFLFWGGSF